MKGNKYIDIALIIFMSYFAIARFSEGKIGFGILFTVLALMNVLVYVMKIKTAKQSTDAK